jgi:hypothetical protein
MSRDFDRVAVLRIVAGVLAGWATSSVVLSGGFALLKASWPEYALAYPDKAYTLTMLFVRLFIFSSMIAATSTVATLVAGNKWLAWVAGGAILAVSIPPHAYPGYVWDDYPPWYHGVYLLSILPIALIAGGWATRRFPGAFREVGAG